MGLTRDLELLDLMAPRDVPVEKPPARVRLDRRSGLAILFVCLLLPAYQEFAGLRLSPLRVFLIACFVPFTISVLMGKAGRISSADLLILAYCVWIFVALSVVHGSDQLPFAGISVIEALGGYMAGRILIRSTVDYKRLIKILFVSLALLVPTTLIEAFTGWMVIPELIDQLVLSNTRDPSAYGRLGLDRVYSVFEHPILFGLYSVAGLTSFYYMLGQKLSLAAIALSLGMTFFALSSAPLIAAAAQIFLILWARLTGGRWHTLILLSVFLYVSVDLLSDRTPVTILIEKLTFNPLSGWTRIAIFDAGITAVINNPVFGIGFNDWPRPAWLTSSVDNFWLLNAMRYGMVGGGLLIAAFLAQTLRVVRAECTTQDEKNTQRAYVITLAAICFTLCTVHVWGSLGVFVMFFLGAGGWMAPAHQKRAKSLRLPDLPTSRADPNQQGYSL
ncbi:MAG: O-antigen ligase family protein [Pseudomonadota bacterium]